MNELFVKRLKILREKRGLQQKDVAEDLEVNYSTYKNWEKGRSEPNTNMLAILADYFDSSIDYLVGRTATEPETVLIRTAAKGKGVQDHTISTKDYLEALSRLEESREKDKREIEELRKKLQGE